MLNCMSIAVVLDLESLSSCSSSSSVDTELQVSSDVDRIRTVEVSLLELIEIADC
jgi:hypothetical protein